MEASSAEPPCQVRGPHVAIGTHWGCRQISALSLNVKSPTPLPGAHGKDAGERQGHWAGGAEKALFGYQREKGEGTPMGGCSQSPHWEDFGQATFPRVDLSLLTHTMGVTAQDLQDCPED